MSQAPAIGYGDQLEQPPRTSIMAILSLICGIVCVPGLGVLAMLLGVGAMLGISSSGGRKKGTGLAVAGLILGLVATAGWIGGYYAAKFGYDKSVAIPSRVMLAVEAGNVAGVQAELVPAAASQVSAESIAAFKAAYEAEHGPLVSAPNGWLSYIGGMSQLGPAAQNMQNVQQDIDNAMPTVCTFANGPGIVIATMDPQAQGMRQAPVDNVGVMLADGSIVWLIPIAP